MCRHFGDVCHNKKDNCAWFTSGDAVVARHAFAGVQNQRASISAAIVPASCAATNAMTPPGAMPANISEIERAIRKRRRGRERIGGGDVKADRIWNGAGVTRRASQDGEQQPEGGDEFREPLAGSDARVQGDLPNRQLEHQMPGPDADDAARDLHGDIGGRLRPWQFTAQRERDAHRGIECALDSGPNVRKRTVSIAPVGSVLQRSASASLPPASFAAMMPEPTTAASKRQCRDLRRPRVVPPTASDTADVFELILQRQPVERSQRQGSENADALVERPVRPACPSPQPGRVRPSAPSRALRSSTDRFRRRCRKR